MMAYLRDVKLPLCLLIILFGMGSWVAVNGVWVELPILVHQLPEGWNLPSYMTIIIQVANIGPLAYTVGHLMFPRVITEKPSAYFIIAIGCVTSLLMPFLWHKTSYIGDSEHGVPFLVLLFLLSVTDCTSSVVFLPFMNNFKPQYMTSYYIGGGFSGLVPSIVAFAQGVGKTECLNTSSVSDLAETNVTEYGLQEMYLPPVFSARDFFIIIFIMMLLCGFAFVALNHLTYCRQEYVVELNAAVGEAKDEDPEGVKAAIEENDSLGIYSDADTIDTNVPLDENESLARFRLLIGQNPTESDFDKSDDNLNADDNPIDTNAKTMERNMFFDNNSNDTSSENGMDSSLEVHGSSRKHSFDDSAKVYERLSSIDDTSAPLPATSTSVMTTATFIYYLILIAWVNAMTNGMLISIQSFACLPYGDQTYQLSATLCNIINPVGCFVAFFITVRSTHVISIMTCVGSILSAYILAVSIYSPHPPLQGTIAGPVLIVTSYTLVYLLFTYIKVNIATLFRLRDTKALLWCGVSTQIGSAIGSTVMFITINVYQLFKQQYACV